MREEVGNYLQSRNDLSPLIAIQTHVLEIHRGLWQNGCSAKAECVGCGLF